MSDCHRCQEIIVWLQGREQGRIVICPICGTHHSKGKQWVVDEDHDVVNEIWNLSDRPTYCSSCDWKGAMKDVKFLEGDCFPFRCPSCGGIIMKPEGRGVKRSPSQSGSYSRSAATDNIVMNEN